MLVQVFCLRLGTRTKSVVDRRRICKRCALIISNVRPIPICVYTTSKSDTYMYVLTG